jgi:hypothetical protein
MAMMSSGIIGCACDVSVERREAMFLERFRVYIDPETHPVTWCSGFTTTCREPIPRHK